MDYPVHFVDQLREHIKGLRKHRGLTQAELGLRLGIGQARVAEIENDPGSVSAEQILALLSALGVTVVLRDRSGNTQAQVAAEPAAVYAAVPARKRGGMVAKGSNSRKPKPPPKKGSGPGNGKVPKESRSPAPSALNIRPNRGRW